MRDKFIGVRGQYFGAGVDLPEKKTGIEAECLRAG